MDNKKLVVIYEPSSEAEFMVVTSLLDAQQISFYQKNRSIQNLFGHGTAHFGFNPITGPIKILVKQKDHEKALQIINDYKASLENNYYDPEDIELDTIRNYKQAITSSLILGLVFPALGIFYLYKAYKLYSDPVITSKSRIYLIVSTVVNIFGVYIWYLALK
jgi:hypothetical protein